MRHALFSFVVVALSVQRTVSHPFDRRTMAMDGSTVLNYALSLEHIENAFYEGALGKFDDKTFTDAGFASWVRERFQQIAEHEATHVAALSVLLGDNAVQACTYSFPYNDVKSFAALSQIIEGVGASAYIGAAQFIADKALLTMGASILSTEARHASWVAAAVDSGIPWDGPFDTPLSPNEVFTLAAEFIVSCPSTNPSLPLKAFPALTLKDVVPGQNAIVQYASTSVTPTFIAFYTGLSKNFVSIVNGEVAVPEGLSGLVYAVATSSGTEATDDTIVAGPTVLSF